MLLLFLLLTSDGGRRNASPLVVRLTSFLRCPVCAHPIILVFDVPGLVNPHLSTIPEV